MHSAILCTSSHFRLQIQGEVRSQGGQAPVKYRGMIQTALGIAREEVSSGQHSAAVCMIVCTAMHDTTARAAEASRYLLANIQFFIRFYFIFTALVGFL